MGYRHRTALWTIVQTAVRVCLKKGSGTAYHAALRRPSRRRAGLRRRTSSKPKLSAADHAANISYYTSVLFEYTTKARRENSKKDGTGKPPPKNRLPFMPVPDARGTKTRKNKKKKKFCLPLAKAPAGLRRNKCCLRQYINGRAVLAAVAQPSVDDIDDALCVSRHVEIMSYHDDGMTHLI